MLYQSYRQCFVTNTGTLLAEGQTVDNLAVGQIGIIDAKTNTAVTLPTYAKNKALYFVWGTPDIDLGDFGGVPNENEYSKLIKGKKIKRIRAKKAQRGQTPIYTVGWSGDSTDTNSLHAKKGESKVLFIKLTGDIIDRLYGTQGFIKQLVFEPECVSDCDTDLCEEIDPRIISSQLVKKFNEDKDLRKFAKAKELISGSEITPPSTTTCYKFALTVCDTGDDTALGLVQAQYPNDSVTRIDRVGAMSTYEIVRFTNSTPTAFSSSRTFVTDCPTCPSGTTLIESAFAYTMEVAEGTDIEDEGFGIDILSFIELHTEGGRTTYKILTEEEVTDIPEGVTLVSTGVSRNICTAEPTTVAWTANGTALRQSRNFRLTIADSVCGTNRLDDIQAAYPDLVITAVNANVTACVHTYEATVYSNCYEDGCAIDEVKFPTPAPFEGANWEEVVPALTGTDIKAGIQIETGFFNRKTNECTFDYFPYENDVVHVQISEYNPDFNASPCEGQWAVKQIRAVKYPQGHGEYVKRMERDSKAYDHRYRSTDPVVREAQGYSLQADANKYYDEYVIEYEIDWFTSGGWGEKYNASYSQFIYVPEGTGAALENALLSYATSTGIDEDSITLN